MLGEPLAAGRARPEPKRTGNIAGAGTASSVIGHKNILQKHEQTPWPLAPHPSVPPASPGGQKGRRKVEAPVPSFSPGAGRGQAQQPRRDHFLPSRAAGLAPPKTSAVNSPWTSAASSVFTPLFCFSVVKLSLLIRVPQPGIPGGEMARGSWRYSWCQYLRLAVLWALFLARSWPCWNYRNLNMWQWSVCCLFWGRGGKQAVNDGTIGVPAPRKSQERASVPFL